MPPKGGADVHDVDCFGIETLRGGEELVRAVLVRVDELIMQRSGEENEDGGREGEVSGGVGYREGELRFGGGEGVGDGGFPHRGTERSFAAGGEPAEEVVVVVFMAVEVEQVLVVEAAEGVVEGESGREAEGAGDGGDDMGRGGGSGGCGGACGSIG